MPRSAPHDDAHPHWKPVLVAAIGRIERLRPGAIRIAVVAVAAPPVITIRARLRLRGYNRTRRAADNGAGDGTAALAQRTADNCAKRSADDGAADRSRCVLRRRGPNRH